MQTPLERQDAEAVSPLPEEDLIQPITHSYTSLLHSNDSAAPVTPHTSPSQIHLVDHRPGALHLAPCTLQEYLELGYDNEDRYELVEGVLVWSPNMADDEHKHIVSNLVGLVASLPRDHQPKVRAIQELSLQVFKEKQKGKLHQDTSSPASPGRSSSSRDSGYIEDETSSRYPDVFIYDLAAESENRTCPDPLQKGGGFPL